MASMIRVLVVRAPVICAFLALARPVLSAQSPFKPVPVQSCAIGDSLLGPLAEDRNAIVRADYLKKVDSTMLVAGPEESRTYETQAHLTYIVSYGDHHPSAYPRIHLSFFLEGGPTALGRPGEQLPVTMIVDGSSISLGSVTVPSRSMFTFDVTLTPNHSFVVAGASDVVFTLGRISKSVAAHDLRDVRGMYRLALCGESPPSR